MKKRRSAAILSALAAAGIVATLAVAAAGYKTTQPHYLVPTAPGVVADPILSAGDLVGPYQMSGIPDGLGAYAHRGRDEDHGKKDHGRTFTVLMNHELDRLFPVAPNPHVDSRISKLTIDADSHSVVDAEYVFDGLEGFSRFCSSTLRVVEGTPWYFTGEETSGRGFLTPEPDDGTGRGGTSIAMNARTGEWFETRHFGLLQHENVVPLRLSKWVFLTTDDDFRNVNNPPGYPVRENAYLYAYIAKSFKAALSGDPKKGSLHVWVPDNPAMGSNAAVNTKDDPVPGHFVPITQAENATAETLKAAATLRGAFKFDRLEDATPQRGRESRVFFADTGKLPTTNRGRIYQLDFNRHDPTQATLRLVLSGDPPYRDDIYNPDNLDASERVLMIQEDRESQWRDAIHNGGYGRVMEYRFSDRRLRSVARVNTPPGVPPYLNPTPCAACRPGDWESSGIIDARHVLGQDWWLLDVQAHRSTASQPGPGPKPYPPAGTGTGEAGQLLALYVPNSQGRHDDDDDEEEEDDD